MDYRRTFTLPRLWWILFVLVFASFVVLLFVGGRLYQVAPPVPEKVVTSTGEVIFTRQDIQEGMDVWRSLGGMQLGSVWGHGAYLAPDWTADFLHREAEAIIERRSGRKPSALTEPQLARYSAILGSELKVNTYNPETGVIVLSEERERAIRSVQKHYLGLFGANNSIDFHKLRIAYAIQEKPLGLNPDQAILKLSSFWWWTAWASVTQRPDDKVSYTNNWPHEPLVNNTPTAFSFLWTFLSIVILIAAIGLLCWFFNRQRATWEDDLVPEAGYSTSDPLEFIQPTSSMKACTGYFWIVILLIGFQILLGAVTAHYAVEGQDFYGIPLSEWFPYSLTRTWHVQLAVLWIATAWLGAGLYAVPLIAGKEPRFQAIGVWLLLLALLVAVVGSLFGEWAAIQGLIKDPVINFWFGHQGYEFLDLGRFWQWLIFLGLLIWLGLMARGILPAICRKEDDGHLLLLLFLSSAAVALLYGVGLLYDRHTHLTLAEYWRWWVVHLWVEGIFEVFAAAWVSWIFVKIGLIRASTAAIYVIFSTAVFLGGGVLGTFHHLYFAGTPESVLALGAVFSALEVVPLALIAFDAHDHWQLKQASPWVAKYRLPLMFFLAVAFWNLVGAGVLGFLINPPLALYYLQGLQTTPTHGHAALFGVYGMLGIGMMLFCLRGLRHQGWSDKLLLWVFWLLNGGLALMVFGSLLPQGLIQGYVSFSEGYWYARSPELLHSPLMQTLVWIRVPGDVVFALGALLLLIFMIRLYRKV
ncbi:MAG: nitric-oxide reductase large subunit [Endozoicomonas sp.]|uniref:nitric-oxide reductase large subunit n=1 Tax=Endozoicomonas sp. TaxID=1892382 RepID=UPI003D9B0BE6